MNSEPFSILIIGGGIAGIMAALLLERKGFHITLIEQCQEWKPVGGGITLTLNGVKLLQQIGLLNDIEGKANEIRHINIADKNGNLLSTFNLNEYAHGYAKTLTILRHDLHNILLANLKTTKVYTGTVFTAVNNEAHAVKVELSNGNIQSYNLVIGCDGINSSLRKAVFATKKNIYSGYSSWRFIADSTDSICCNTITELWGIGKRFGIVPLNNNKVHCFASVNTSSRHKIYQDIGCEDFKRLFAGFGGGVPALLDSLQNSSQLMYNDLEDVPIQKYYKGRVILLGDAAHGMTPNLTQGASMAIEDAVLLANSITGVHEDVENILAKVYAQRCKRVHAIQKKSNLLGKIGQINTPVLCGIRNFCWKKIPDKWIQNDLKNLLMHQIDVPNDIIIKK